MFTVIENILIKKKMKKIIFNFKWNIALFIAKKINKKAFFYILFDDYTSHGFSPNEFNFAFRITWLILFHKWMSIETSEQRAYFNSLL